ncbi:hypothetical protein GCM10009119_17850 [Algoriphagus jejuensis]|uniref:Uncharacterized protein n=1 Tax=Algoriphagus jejuensis TaxID=419934 RepID=A0ABP3YD41_9BACT
MIWFDIKELERGLRNGDVSDRMVFNYLLTSLILTSLAMYVTTQDYELAWLVAVEVVVMLAITVVGTKRTFEINAAGDGKDYFRRYFSLSMVTGIRLVVFCIPAGLALGIVGFFLLKILPPIPYSKDLFNIILVPVIGVWYYLMLSNSFKRVSQ